MRARSGIARCDVVVILVVVGLAAALLAPAAAKARQANLNLQKTSNLRQGGFALQDHSNRFNALPRLEGPYQYALADNMLPRLEPAPEASARLLGGDLYAAIAFSFNTGKWGYSYNYGTRADAETVAIRNCKADDCQVLVWATDACCALAVGDNNKYGYGWNYDKDDAIARALRECQQRTENCQLKCWTCTDR